MTKPASLKTIFWQRVKPVIPTGCPAHLCRWDGREVTWQVETALFTLWEDADD